MEKPKNVRKTIDIPDGLSTEIDQYQTSHYHSTNSQAIIQLIHMGLMYTRKIEEQSLHPLYTQPNQQP